MKFLDVIALCEGTLLTPDVDHVPEIKRRLRWRPDE